MKSLKNVLENEFRVSKRREQSVVVSPVYPPRDKILEVCVSEMKNEFGWLLLLDVCLSRSAVRLREKFPEPQTV